MKYFIKNISFTFLILTALSATTYSNGPEDVPPGSNLHFETWCEGDVIKAIDEDGQSYSSFDCYDANMRCTEDSLPHADWVIVNATCE